mmetsp:Transcript_48800/g.156304  ORF Transcript_48800/g.156304 Transcript_48800/m.156304 type:complete len:253 (-) Transcript_48800:919-1677(-)
MLLFTITRGKSSAEKGSLVQMYDYKYQKMKVNLEEKEQALTETFKVLEQMKEANKKQEDTLQEIKRKLAQQDSELKLRKEALHKRDVAVRLKEEAEAERDAALQATQICRQEAAAALTEKEHRISHADNAVESARREVDSLTEEVRTRDGHVAQAQGHLSNCNKQVSMHKAATVERERSLEWLAEKTRQNQERHEMEVQYAKQERSCHKEVEHLRAQLNAHKDSKLLKDLRKGTEMVHGRISNRAAKRGNNY